MPVTFIATEIPRSGPRVIHEIQVPAIGEPGFYRQAVSLGSFQSGRRRGLTAAERACYRVTPAWAPGRLYLLKRAEEWERDVGISLRALRAGGVEPSEADDELKLPRVRHESIWDFYAHIGWDRKRRCYVDASGKPIRYSAVPG